MGITVRRCTVKDLDTLRNLSIDTYVETFEAYNTPENMDEYLGRAYEAGKLRREIECKDSTFLFAYYENNLAGYIKFNESPNQTEINDAKSLEVERLYVLKAYQDKGIGRYLMELAINTAKERNKEYIWLGVWERNFKAQRFYGRYNFYRIGEHIFPMGDDPQIDYILRKDLL